MQGVHEVHVSGHIELTPPKEHLFLVALFLTQEQPLEIIFPFFLSLNRKDVSLQEGAPVGLDDETTGAGMITTGAGVTTVGADTGAVVAGDGGSVVPMQLSNIPTPYPIKDII